MANYRTSLLLSTSADPNLAEQGSASIHILAPSNTSSIPNMELPPIARIEIADPTSGDDPVPKNDEVQTLLSNALEELVAGMRGLFVQTGDDLSKRPVVRIELILNDQSLVWSRVRPDATVLRVGSLELDLLRRTAKRGNRPIDLRPREFQLLGYMMRRSDELLTRETLLKEVWQYKFVPETNLVDVHMGKLRRKVDGSDEAPMIRTVRGEGFILSPAPSRMAGPEVDFESIPIL
jgi:DNA-binding winged helix-turn-helix (wHTH) protein